ncbi:MAG: conjugative transposon protein TraM [Chitinophagaceae bacterium]|nr:MAG: conjugative transposon protein TraM [Chitinophagaceae bacterium]
MKQMEKEMSQARLRKRKKLLVLPLLVIPFLTMAFWSLGGGKMDRDAQKQSAEKGLNLKLPDANLKSEEASDKLSFYDRAAKDSAKLQEWIRNDPYYKKDQALEAPTTSNPNAVGETITPATNEMIPSPYSGKTKAPEDELMQKLSKLQRQLARPETAKKSVDKQSLPKSGKDEAFSGEVDRLEAMMRLMEEGEGDDPEMQKIDQVMDKILDIQHPERVKERIKEKSVVNKEKVYPVQVPPFHSSVSLLDTGRKRLSQGNPFYGIEKEDEGEESFSVEAVVHQTQSLVSGAVIKLRLISDVYINGSLVPKGTFVFGTATLNGERLEVHINSIRSGSSLFPVSLHVYDLDGLAGIYVPGAIGRDVAKGSMDNATQMLEITSLDPSLKAQATNAGVSAAKTLLSKKAKLVKVMVKAGYKVLLKDK